MHFSSLTLLSALVSTATAYSATERTFAVNHFYGKGPLTMGRVDPIVNPGAPSGHVHAIQGGNAFGMTMSKTQALEQSTCTSSLVKNDKSNYWTPALYFKDPKTGALESVELFYMNVYYFFEATTDKIQAFEPGMRMVVGNPSLRTPPSSGGDLNLDLGNGKPAQPVQWTCPRSNTAQPLYPVDSDGLHGAGIQDSNNKGAGTGFPDQNCDGYASPLRADIHFPSCYNPAVGLEDYKNNAVFPTNGNCPEGWIHTPHLFYEVYWNTNKFASRWTPGQGTQPFVLAQGDPTGYGLHADFLSGWDKETLQQIIDNCDAGDRGMDKCPGLIGGLNDPSTTCNIPNAVPETISGTMAALPGNNPIGNWGVTPEGPVSVAPAGSSSSAAAVPVATSTKVSIPTAASSLPVTLATIPTSPASSAAISVPDTYQTTTSTHSTTVTVSESKPTPTSTINTTIADGWSYKGCFQDGKRSNRVLSGIKFANVGKVSNKNCITYCSKAGFSIAGTEYAGQCFCGNSLSTETPIEESKCSMACKGDASQICGGSLALSVYHTKTNTATKTKRSVRSRHLHNHLSSHVKA